MTETPPRKSSRLQYTKPDARPFAASASKRSSVLALGRIDHLQHYFVKEAAKAAKTPSSSPHANARRLPSFGADALLEDDEELEDLPPSPDPPRDHQDPMAASVGDRPPSLKELRADCWSSVDQVCQRWKIVDHVKQRRSSSQMSTPDLGAIRSEASSPDPLALDEASSDRLIVDLMQTTTEAIRAVQRLMLALPNDSLSMDSMSLSPNDSPLSSRHQSQLGISTAARPRTSLGLPPPPSRSSSLGKSKTAVEDGPTTLRKASLDLLGLLREMDVQFRAHQDVQPDVNPDEAADHVYTDVTLDDLIKEKEQVKRWIQLVDVVLFASLQSSSPVLVESPIDHDGPVRILSPMPEDAARQEADLPEWARASSFAEEPLRRAHALLTTQLPGSAIFRLAPPHGEDGSREDFLDSLSDGQLLCLAFNGALAQSERPWGFIQIDSLHTIAAEASTAMRRQSSEQSQKKVGTTFRRLENLQVWVAALRLRYGILLGSAAALSRERSTSKEALIEAQAVEFDAKRIARREDRWADMLEYALLKWVAAVVKERQEGSSS